jgi:hypothetical protein
MQQPDRWFWISLEYATFAICSRDGVIVDAPPIARWMVSKRLTDIKPWLLRQPGQRVVELIG